MTARRLALAAAAVLPAFAACTLDERALVPNIGAGAAGTAGTASGGGGNGSGGGSGANAGGSASGGAPDGGSGGSVAGTSGTGGAASGGSGASGGAGSGGVAGTATAGNAGAGGNAGSSGSAGTGGTAPLFFDDFGDGVADGWLGGFDFSGAPFGTWTVVTDGAEQRLQASVDSLNSTWFVGGNVNWTNVRIELDFQFLSFIDAITSSSLFVACRFVDFDNYVRVSYSVMGQVSINTVSAGTGYALSSGSRAAPATNTWYKLTIVAQGETIQVSIDDELLVTGSTAAHPNGGVTLSAYGADIRFDNVLVTAL